MYFFGINKKFIAIEKSFCYSEGPNEDRTFSNSQSEVVEDVWYGIKPPRLYTKEFFPLITARQIYVTRILLDGKRAVIDDGEDFSSKHKEKVNISMNKKKSAVRFLAQAHLD